MRNLIWTHAVILMIDVQNDFCPGGRFAVSDGDAIIDGTTR